MFNDLNHQWSDYLTNIVFLRKINQSNWLIHHDELMIKTCKGMSVDIAFQLHLINLL